MLLDNEYRVISCGDAQGLLTPPPYSSQPLSGYWDNFDTWLAQYQTVDPDPNNFQTCIPGAMASLTPLGDQHLLHIWKHLDVLQSSLSLLQFHALVFDANQTLVYANTAPQNFLASLGLRDWETLLPDRWRRDFPDWLKQNTAINLERETQGMCLAPWSKR